MTQKEKSLLLQDLCARLPYGVKGLAYIVGEPCNTDTNIVGIINKSIVTNYESPMLDLINLKSKDITIKPYLRPMSSMTEEEKEELLNLLFDKEAKYFYIDEEGFIDGKTSDLMKEGFNYPAFCPINIELYTDFLLSYHFDYRGLIEKGLALKALDNMYNVKEK